MKILFLNALIINEKRADIGSVLTCNDIIECVRYGQNSIFPSDADQVIDCQGKMLLPGAIDTHVHFREPGPTHKATIATESAAAVAGGVTSYVEMPNTNPQTTTLEALDDKFARAARNSVANYSFWLGATNQNFDTLAKTDYRKVCGVKLFLGSSTGNMLVDNAEALEKMFTHVPAIIAAHCEDEATIAENTRLAVKEFGDNISFDLHQKIRSAEACYKSAAFAADMARRCGARLHLLHLSTATELNLLDVGALNQRRITGEACVGHLYFTNSDYPHLQQLIKVNPSIKTRTDRDALRRALEDGRIAVVSTDHAPHTFEEKQKPYLQCPSGMPMVQHSLAAMLSMVDKKLWRATTVVERMCHAPAILFGIEKRGFIRPGYKADLVVVARNKWRVSQENILYKCGWSPLEGKTFQHQIVATYVNGKLVFDGQNVDTNVIGEQLIFNA